MGTSEIRYEKIKAQFPKVLEKYLGIISKACEHFNISRNTFYWWYKKDPKFAEACDAVQEYVGDHVECKLLEKIDSGDTTAIIFYCKTKLKYRGFIERSEQTGADGSPLFMPVATEDIDMLEAFIARKAKEYNG